MNTIALVPTLPRAPPSQCMYIYIRFSISPNLCICNLSVHISVKKAFLMYKDLHINEKADAHLQGTYAHSEFANGWKARNIATALRRG